MRVSFRLVKNRLKKQFKDAQKAEQIQGIVKATVVQVGSKAREIITDKDIIDTGALRNSVQARKVTNFEFEVGNLPITFYGKFHEFGTRYLTARPFLRPAADYGREKLKERIRKLKML